MLHFQINKKVKLKSKMKIKFLIALLTTSFWAKAQSNYDLNQCIDIGLKQNLQIKTAENEILKTKYLIADARSGLLPQISAGVDYNYYFDLAVQALPASLFGGPPGEFRFAALGVNQIAQAKIDISQQIFNPQMLLIGLKAIKVAATINDVQVRKTKEDVACNISTTYYNLLTLYQSVDLLDSNIVNLDKLIKSTSVLAQNSLAKKTDVDRLVLTKKSLEVQKVSLNTSIDYLLNLLKLLMGLKIEDNLSINQKDFTPNLLQSTDSTDLKRNTTIELLEIQKAIKLIEQKSILVSYMPSLMAIGSYGSQAFNDKFSPFERLSGKSYPVSMIGLKLSIPIYDGGGKRNRILLKNVEIKNTELQIAQVRQQTQTEYTNSIAKYNASIIALKLEEENVILAKKIYADNQLLYKQSLVGITEIINTQNELLKTETNRLKAMVNIRLAVLEIQKLNNSIIKN